MGFNRDSIICRERKKTSSKIRRSHGYICEPFCSRSKILSTFILEILSRIGKSAENICLLEQSSRHKVFLTNRLPTYVKEMLKRIDHNNFYIQTSFK